MSQSAFEQSNADRNRLVRECCLSHLVASLPLLAKKEHLEAAQSYFSDTGVNVTTDGRPYLGAAIGTEEYTNSFVLSKVQQWCSELKALIGVTPPPPGDLIRDLLVLPAKFGGISMPNPSKISNKEYASSLLISEPLRGLILSNPSYPIDAIAKNARLKKETHRLNRFNNSVRGCRPEGKAQRHPSKSNGASL